jgi:VIT1/CCC1 family predicted Fe2+/Mn2+ transporter
LTPQGAGEVHVPHLIRAIPAGTLDPVDRASEVIFGLLMAMTFVGSVSVADAGREELRTLLIAALGCNLAWGIADAVMYLVGVGVEERRRHSLLVRLHSGIDAVTGRGIIADGFVSDLAPRLDDEDLERLRRRLLETPPAPTMPRLGLDDYRAALGVFLWVVVATFPVVLPYLFIDEVMLALRLSQAIAIVLLFLAGAALARYSGGSIWRIGFGMAALGIVLLAALIALGG